MPGDILTERRGTTGIVTIDRPARRNALRHEDWGALAAAVRGLGAEPGVRAIVLRGAGEVAFASGGDIAEFATRRGTPEAAAEYHAAVAGALGALAAAEQPTIAMIHGHCLGGGCALAVACDLRVAADDARFGIPAARLNVVLGVAELRGLLATVGLAAAKEILLTGRTLDAGEALRIGLVNHVIPKADLLDATLALAERIAAGAPIALAAAKALLDRIARGDDAASLADAHADFSRRAFASPDSREGARAFIEGRPPRFSGDRR